MGSLARSPALLKRALGLFLPPPSVTPGERDAFREHLLSAAWGGISGGIVILTDVILAKSLGAPGWQVTLLATLGPAANLASFYWAGQVSGRRKAGYFLLAAVVGRLPLLLLLLRNTAGWLIGLNFLYATATALLITAANAIFQTRYPDASRARYFGLATSVGAICSIAAVQGSGMLLESRPLAYPWLFGLAGITGLISAYHLFRMEAGAKGIRTMREWLGGGYETLRRRVAAPATITGPGFGQSYRMAREVLRENPGFVRFETAFMVYGFAFLSILPVLPLYVVKELAMNYHQLSSTKGVWSQIGLVFLSPVLAVSLGRLRPLRFTGRIFFLLALYPFCLLISTIPGWIAPEAPFALGTRMPAVASVVTAFLEGPAGVLFRGSGRIAWVYAALFFYSIAMTGVNLSWTLGSMHFAGKRDASDFQGIHVAMTGIRGLFAPALGFAVYSVLGSGAVFAISTALFAMAGALMLRQDRDERREDRRRAALEGAEHRPGHEALASTASTAATEATAVSTVTTASNPTGR